ncbi:MAG: hypothetical protein RJA76_853 [Bacteroidota bacterium]
MCFVFFINFAQNSLELKEVIIEAPKFQEKFSRTGKVVLVIDSAQIAQAKGKGIVELLQTQAGIQSVGARSAWGANQELYMRGSNTGQILILLDGFPLNDPSHISQVFDWNLLDLSQFSRIEILKGGQSVIYGSDAMAGVINLITKVNSKNKREAIASLNTGSFGYFSPSIQLKQSFKKQDLAIWISHVGVKGFSAADVLNGETDGFQRDQFRLAWTSYLSSRWEWFIQANASKYRGNLDAGPNIDDLDYTSQAQSFSLNSQLKFRSQNTDLFLRFFSDFSKRRFEDDSTFIPNNAYNNYYFSNYGGLSQGLELYGKTSLGKGLESIYGLENRWQHASQSDYYANFGYEFSSPEIKSENAKQSIFAVFLTLQKDWKFAGLEMGGRLNKQSTYGTFSTFSINPYLRINDHWKVFGNIYQGFKVPSIYQLFSAYGNIDLLPEKSKTFEAGIQFKNASHFYRLVWFSQQVNDGIGFQSKSIAPYGQYFNFVAQQSSGLEIEANKYLGKFKLSGNYTYLNGSTQMNENNQMNRTDYLVRRPKHQASAMISAIFGKKWSGNLTYQYVGRRIDLVFDEMSYSTIEKELKSYHWVDLSFAYQMNAKIRFNLLIKNILNQKIVELYGYNGLPVAISGGVDIRF